MVYIHTIFLFACFAAGVLSSSLLSPCKVTDSACIDKSVQAALPAILSGIPSLGVESSDPLFVEKINGDLSIIKYVFYNTTVVGFKQCKVSDIKVTPDLKNLHYGLLCNNLKLSGQYEISGRLVVLPVEGQGDYELIADKYKIVVDAEMKKSAGSDGKTYLAIKNFKLKCDALAPIKFDFRNLFNGQKDLSDAVHKFANENWPEVAKLVQDPTWYGSLKKVINNVNKYLKTVALEDIIIN